jgi:hypothetical protein
VFLLQLQLYCAHFKESDVIGYDNHIEGHDVGGACISYGDMRNGYTVLVGKYEGKGPVRNP